MHSSASHKATKPGAARDLLKALRSLMRYCVLAELREDDPTAGVKLPRHRTEGFYSWDENDIAKYRAHHALGTRPRLAFELLLNTGLRRSDAVRVGQQHIHLSRRASNESEPMLLALQRRRAHGGGSP